jgi:hypothetical protein
MRDDEIDKTEMHQISKTIIEATFTLFFGVALTTP